MKVKLRSYDMENCPIEIEPYTRNLFLEKEKKYVVYAVVVHDSGVHYLIRELEDLTRWRPAWLFEMVSNDIPTDWNCNSFVEKLWFIMGPKYITESLEAYDSMTENEPEYETFFYDRIEMQKKTCPSCGYTGLPEYLDSGKPFSDYIFCDCCGFEYGYNDGKLPKNYKEHRRKWIESGAKWLEPDKKTENWDLFEQFKNIPVD